MNLPEHTAADDQVRVAISGAAIVPLPGFGVIAVEGEDARSFLQGQLTNDVLALDGGSAQLNGYCSPKGRLLASFLNWTDGKTIYLALPRDLLETVRKRLSMFVLRAKAKLAEAPLAVFGFAGEHARNVIERIFGEVPEALWSRADTRAGTLIRVPDANGAPRWLAFVAPEQAAALEAAAAVLAQADASYWNWLDIRAGLPWILPATQDKFVPQMINFEALGGVNFKKGCYPGQEVVARSQYLGKLKRRTLPAHAEDISGSKPPLPGDDVYGPDGKPVGIIVNAAASPARPDAGAAYDLLVELPLASLEGLRLTPGGQSLTLASLPYDLPDNEVFVRPKL